MALPAIIRLLFFRIKRKFGVGLKNIIGKISPVPGMFLIDKRRFPATV
jgi:hypothetical protein